MAHGIEIYDSAGNPILTMTDTVTRYIWTTTVNAGASGSQNLTIYHPSSCEITIEVVAYALEQGKMVHDTNGPLSISASTTPIVKTSTVKNISWTAQSITNGVSTFASSNSIILVFVH